MELVSGDKMANKVNVKKYNRKIKGKTYKVKGHIRKVRKLGKKIRYKPVGKFLVAHDELGNFRGSKVVPIKKRKSTKRPKIKKKRIKRKSLLPFNKDILDRDYISGKLNYSEWIKKRKRIMGL